MAGQMRCICWRFYSASKAALINFAKSIAKKYKYISYCNCINHGPLESKMTKMAKKIKRTAKNFKIKNEKFKCKDIEI